MNPERWKQIDVLFDAVLDLPENEREKFIVENSDGDEDLRNEVLSLLKAQTSGSDFMENSAMRIAAENLAVENRKTYETQFLNKIIGNYVIESLLGSGGMGEVYLARDEKLNRQVALKILPAEFVSDDERVKRFQGEARAISALNHPNIVTIYDVGTFENINFIATEYVAGKTLREVVGSNLKITEILRIISQCCEALAVAHANGIVHRDIKPENIMIRPDGYLKILDFGLAKLTDVSPQTFKNLAKTAKGIIIGTPAYMSPEQIADDMVDHRTDLWSIGVVLYELLTGTNPFKRQNRQATFQAILAENLPPPSSLNPEVPDELDHILIKALEKDPDLSYQTASDLRADLKRVRRELDSSSSLQSRNSLTQKREAAETRRYFLPFAFLLLPLLAVGGWFLYKNYISNESVEAVEWMQAKHVLLTRSADTKGYPSLSPEGKNFIYTIRTREGSDIYSQRIGGKNPVNLTGDSAADDWMPAFSPDGKSIVFRSERSPNGIYLMEETGENKRRVADSGYHPSWSPDGKNIVVSDKASDVATSHTIPNSSLWTIDVATGDKKMLETGGDAIQPSWSPNGKRIAFWFVEQGRLGEIATIPADGGKPVVITQDAAMDWNPVWSPDGKYIFFGSDRGGNMNIWRVPVDEETGQATGNAEAVPTPSTYVRHFAFSRDGKTLAYIRYETKSNLHAIGFDLQNLKTVGEVNFITSGNNQVSTPAMSPDGNEFVFRYPMLTQEDLVILNRDGSNQRKLTDDKFRDRTPRWSPDGTKIAFASDRSGKYQIYVINADGSDLRQITFTEKTGATAPIFSPDGSKIVFNEIENKKLTPYILDMTKTWQQQTPEPLPPVPNYKGSYSARDWSDDGNKLLLLLFESENNEQGIVVYDFRTKTYEKITDSGSYPVWLKDNRHFLFEKQHSLVIGDTQTKTLKEIYKLSSYTLQHPDISPDNRLIYFRYLQVDADVWLLDASQN